MFFYLDKFAKEKLYIIRNILEIVEDMKNKFVYFQG